MRIGMYGLNNLKADEFEAVMEYVKKKFRRYSIEFIEGITNEVATNTELKKYCTENEIKLEQIPARWDDLRGCKFPRTNKFGRPYNPNAANRRDEEIINTVAREKKGAMVIVTNSEDKYAAYNAWLCNNKNILTLMLDADTGEWMTNKKRIDAQKNVASNVA